jgi:predicted transcriptional regulator
VTEGIQLNKRLANQDEVAKAIEVWYAEHPFGPTYRDLAERTGLALGTVHATVRDLCHSGVVEFDEGKARTIRLV